MGDLTLCTLHLYIELNMNTYLGKAGVGFDCLRSLVKFVSASC